MALPFVGASRAIDRKRLHGAMRMRKVRGLRRCGDDSNKHSSTHDIP
jgi:hypothetical protein